MSISRALELALQHHKAGRLIEAKAIYRQILAADPQHADALHFLGVIAHQTGRNDLAVKWIRQAVALNPNSPAAHSNLAAAYRAIGQREEALAADRRALELDPDCPEAHFKLGNALSDLRRPDEALTAYRRALELNPDYPEAHYNLANTLKDQGHLDEAIGAYRQAILLRPAFAEACNNLGSALVEQGRPDEATAAYHRALQLKPDYAEAHNNLGYALKDQGQFDEAIGAFRRALHFRPDFVWAHSNLIYTLRFHPKHDDRMIAEEHERWNRQFADPQRQFAVPHSNDRSPGRRLRIGYVSPNFYRHVIHNFLIPLLEAHNHAKFEIYCYSSVRRPDRITERLRQTADVWREVFGVRDEELAGKIHQDEIDILVDLTQHMADNRLPVFARKPAPVQVAWLGDPGGTGLRTMDYRLTDARMDPDGASWSKSVEEAVRLPGSWFCFDPIEEFPAPGELPAQRAGHVTFGCLNNFCKVNEAVFSRWAKVMHTVAGSRLVLRCPEGAARDRVRKFFQSQGIGVERLNMVAWTATRTDFLKLFHRIDIALDPSPYNGGTTTCEALWMGVPVLTLPGAVVVSRQGLSILSAVGLPELAADSEAEYVRLAAKLARDIPRLAELRATLRERMKSSPLMDAPRFARNIEHAYREMWRTWCAKRISL